MELFEQVCVTLFLLSLTVIAFIMKWFELSVARENGTTGRRSWRFMYMVSDWRPRMRSKLKKALFIILALLSASFVLSSPGKVRAAPIAHLQSTLANTSALVTSLSATFASAVGNGDLVVVATSSWNTGNTASITSVTDSKGNSSTQTIVVQYRGVA